MNIDSGNCVVVTNISSVQFAQGRSDCSSQTSVRISVLSRVAWASDTVRDFNSLFSERQIFWSSIMPIHKCTAIYCVRTYKAATRQVISTSFVFPDPGIQYSVVDLEPVQRLPLTCSEHYSRTICSRMAQHSSENSNLNSSL